MDLDPFVGSLKVENCQKIRNFDTCLFSNSHFSESIGFTSFIKVLIDTFFLYNGLWIEIASSLHNQQTFHDGPKMPKSATFIDILSIFKLIKF